jgi:hypothetical protein
MESPHCPTMWSTYDENSKGEKFNGRRHGCRFPKGHKGGLCMCNCGLPHKNMDTSRAQQDTATV